jgi:hypothetical protein
MPSLLVAPTAMPYVSIMIDFMRRLRTGERASGDRGVPAAWVVAVGLHVGMLVLAALIPLREPERREDTLQLSFLPRTARGPEFESTRADLPANDDRNATASAGRVSPVSDPSLTRPQAEEEGSDARVAIVADDDGVSVRDGSRQTERTSLRSVLDRGMSPEQAMETLAGLLAQYPQYRETVLREMIAGQGLPPDSLPRINLYLDQILKDGIKPTWETQRRAVEEAGRSFDPVQGWTNKGGYGPQINVLGIIFFLIDLIEGKE